MGWKWIQLVRTEELPADCVLLAGEELVVFLRKAVKDAYPNDLANCDAAHLKVYATRTAYSDVSNRQPLAASMKLVGLGDTEDSALVVEAPQRAIGVPESRKRKWEFAQDVWIQALVAGRCHDLPLDHTALCHYLERELPQRMPVDEIVDNVIMSPKSGFTTENSYIHYWDELIVTVLENVSNGKGTYVRNSNANTSTGLCRPDLCFYYTDGEKACVFLGEEKCESDMKVPLEELSSKLIWRYDDAPYVFGYAAVAYSVSLVMIRRDRVDPRRAVVEVLHTYNLQAFTHRLAFLLALLNLSTLFPQVVALIRSLHIPDFGDLVRPNGVRLSFGRDRVMKVYPLDMPAKNIIDNLVTLHDKMTKDAIPNVVNLVRTNTTTRRVVMAPIGRPGMPKNVPQLLMALRDILTALVAMHKLRIMHRDLRWDNVLKYEQDEDKWFLIDFDDGAFAPASQGATHFDQRSHPPEITSPSHTEKVDIWGIGFLLQTATVEILPRQLQVLQERCLQVNPRNRPTARSLLQDVKRLLP